MHPVTSKPTLAISIWVAYVFFVVYGSLVPLDFRPLPIDKAWTIFLQTPMYKLGVESRADWIANGVLYVPIGFLTAYLLIQLLSDARKMAAFFLAGLFALGLAFSVEFAQIFFPPRTVSLNDLLAESVGSLVGLALVARYSDWFKVLLNAFFGNPKRLSLRLVEAYLAAYVAFSLFPYDLLLSGAELEQKMLGDHWGWLLAGDQHGTILTALKLLTEIALTLPFGLFLGYRSAHRSVTYGQAILLGIALGGFIEIAQLFTATGVSQGLSVLTRIAGVCGGLGLWNRRANWSPETLAALARRFTFPLGAIYLLLLLQANGWFSHDRNSEALAISRLGDLHFIPFYYHYFTSEAKALVSLVVVCLMYLPIGLLTWANRGTPSQAFFFVLLVASVIETGKLFLQGMHPDPTNVMLGALTSYGTVHLARALSKAFSMRSDTNSAAAQAGMALPREPIESPGKHRPTDGRPAMGWVAYVVSLPLLAFAAYWAANFPTQPALLCAFLTACVATVWYRPVLLIVIIPAALPVFDLAPWSGRFYLDEFDLLVLISLVIGYLRVPPVAPRKWPTDTVFVVAGSLMALSYLIGALRGLTPWQMPDANAFTNYYSPFNALRIGKGALWALLATGLLRRMVAAGMNVQRAFTWGVIAGLSLTVVVVFWERVAFSGLFNFASDYRVTGPFSAMHTGGAYIECILAVGAPFVIIPILQSRRILGIAAAMLLLATTYALMVTFSRNGYLAFGVALAIILFFAVLKSGRWQQRSILVVALSGAILAVAFPVFTGQFAQYRIASVGKDYVVRQTHWEDALDMLTPDWLTALFGMGLGRYPETNYLLNSAGSHSGTYQLRNEDGNTFLRLVSGSSIYVEQLASVEPQQPYVLKLDVRANRPDAAIVIPVCEKWLLTSYNCIWNSKNIGEETGVWRQLEIQFNADPLIRSPWYSKRPIKLALYNGNVKTIIDIDNVRLESIRGENLLRNGDFSNELDHWFFSADNHLQWHAKSLPVAVLFDQGWFGLLALCAFSIIAIKRAANRAWRGDLIAAAALASFSGFLVVGLFDTLIDAPRFLFLLLLLGWFSGFRYFAEIKNQGS